MERDTFSYVVGSRPPIGDVFCLLSQCSLKLGHNELEIAALPGTDGFISGHNVGLSPLL